MTIYTIILNKMNKSTPLSQLPGAAPQMIQQPFLNEQHKQMVNNAQAAIQNVSLPQNTQISADIANDDDATIQEVLNQINSSGSSIPQSAPTQEYIPNIQQQYQQPLQQQLQYPTLLEQPIKPITNNSIDVLLNVFADDIKIAILVMVAFVVVNFIPITSILGRYVAIEKIPYHDILLKAMLAATIVLIIKRIALKI